MRDGTARMAAILACLAVAQAAAAAPPAATGPSQLVGGWTVIESANFRLCGITNRQALDALAATCEATREQLASKWLGSGKRPNWDLKCSIVLHPTAQSYLSEVGDGQMTAGSSLIEFGSDRLVTRRIDLRADHPQGYADALAHELTHVVVAERFIEKQIPRWADEGMAVLADGRAKQDLHLADLALARRQRTIFRVVELLNLEQYPGPERQATFYGQSVSLVKFLVERGGPERFMAFISEATRQGYDKPLRSMYGFETLGQLEQAWLSELDRQRTVAQAGAVSPPAARVRSTAMQAR